MSTELLLAQLFNGVGTGLVYFLIAVGLTLIFGVQHFVNFAHGGFFLLGAYLAYAMTAQGVSFWVALFVAPPAVALLGFVVERLFLQRLYKVDHMYQIVGTFALLLIIRELVIVIWGPFTQTVIAPPALQGVLEIGPVVYPLYRVFVVCLAGVLAVALWLLLERTRFGSYLRAGAESNETSSALGINVNRIFWMTFALGVGLAALGGVLASPMRGITPTTGEEILGLAFVVVVVGGMGSFHGAFFAALLIGVVQSVTIGLWPAFGSVVVYLLMALVLLVRTEGLFGSH